MSANGVRPILGAIASRFETMSGDKLTLAFDETGALLKRIVSGEDADLYVLPKTALEGLAKEGKIRPTVWSMCQHHAGTPCGWEQKSDMTTVDGFRRWLLGIKSIVITDPAAGGIGSDHFFRVLQRLGIADEMKSRLTFTSGAGNYNAELVVAGKADAAVQLSHLIRQVRSVDLVALPVELELKVTFAAGIASANRDAAAMALIRFLGGPKAVPVIEGAGMQPR